MLVFDGIPFEFANFTRIIDKCGPPKNIVLIFN